MRTDRIALIVAAIAALVVTATAFAAKPTPSLRLVILGSGSAPAATATSEPAQGGQITFDVSTTATHPSVNVRCYQDGAWVYDGWQSFWAGAADHDPIFTLSSLYWTGGAADCTARLLYFDRQGRDRTLATTDFHVTA